MDEESDNKESWETVIAENEKFKLDWVVRVYNDYLVAAYIEDVKVYRKNILEGSTRPIIGNF